MHTRFLKPAEAEIDEAIAYLDAQRPGLGERFEQDLLETTTLIGERPLIGKVLSRLVRKFRFRRFRYSLVYVVAADEIVIVAVAHHRRRPGYWRSRMTALTLPT